MASFTLRQKEIMTLAAEGDSNEEIARKLCMSPDTVKTHKSKVFEFIGARNVQHAVAILIRKGML